MRIVILGSGNVASVFARLLFKAGNQIVQVYSRHIENAMLLAKDVDAGFISNLKDINTNADFYLVAVSDGAILDVVRTLSLPGKLVAHTAGSVTKDVLISTTTRYGVMYPLQSLKRQADYVPELPLLLDAVDEAARNDLAAIASTITNNVAFANDDERLKLHVAAVVVSNFTNHLYAVAEDYCEKEGVTFSLLQPLINETAHRLKNGKAKDLQTGPAIRNDVDTISKHSQVLAQHPNINKLYDFLSHSIMNYHSNGGNKPL